MVVQSMDLQDFPPFVGRPDEAEKERTHLAGYLKNLLNSQETNSPGINPDPSEQLMFLPSVRSLSQFFKLSPLEIHEVLEGLKKQGYRYLYIDPDAPVTFCKQSRRPSEKGNLACVTEQAAEYGDD